MKKCCHEIPLVSWIMEGGSRAGICIECEECGKALTEYDVWYMGLLQVDDVVEKWNQIKET